MTCKHWNDDWVAHLYCELEPAELVRLEAHLADCTECRATLDALSGSRRALQEAAPSVPAAPRLVVLQPRRLWRPAWAFAAGMACALLLFAAGLWAAPWVIGPSADATPSPALARNQLVRPLTRADLDDALAAQQQAFELRLAAYERGAPGASDSPLAWEDIEDELLRVRNEMRQDQARDFRLLLGEINRNEVRTANWIDENRNVLRYALRNRSDVGEH